MPKRLLLHAFCLALVAGAVGLNDAATAEPNCADLWVTGYASEQFPGTTASGMPTRGNEWSIAAAHPRFPFGTVVTLDGIGPVTIEDRGQLGYSHIDVLTRTAQEAYALTGWYQGCW